MAGLNPLPLYHPLPKSEKIKSKKLLNILFEQGKRIKYNHFHLQALWSSSPHDRKFIFAVSVPKRNVRSAVKRNRIKRVFRHAWQALKGDFKRLLPLGFSLILMFVAYSDISFHELLMEMRHAIQSFLEQYPAPTHG